MSDTWEIKGKSGVYEIQSDKPPTPEQVQAALDHYEGGGWDHPVANLWEGVKTGLSKLNPFTPRDDGPDAVARQVASEPKPKFDPGGAARTVWKGLTTMPTAQGVGEGVTDLGLMLAGGKAAKMAAPAMPGGTLRTMGRAAQEIGDFDLTHPLRNSVGLAGDAMVNAADARMTQSLPGYPKVSTAPAPPPPPNVGANAVPPRVSTNTGTGAVPPPSPTAGTEPWTMPAPPREPPPNVGTNTGSAVPAPKPAGTLPWTARVAQAPPEPPPNVGTGTGSNTPPLGPAGTQPWTAQAPAGLPPPTMPEVTGTGSATPPLGPAGTQPWTSPAPPPPPPAATGTGSAPAGGAVNWGDWAPAPRGAEPPPVAAPPPPAPPVDDVEPGGFVERSKYPAPAETPLAPVKPQPDDAGPAGMLDLQDKLGARDAAAKLGIDPEEMRNATGQRGKPPSAALERINAAIDKMTPEQLKTELATSKNPKLVEAIKARMERRDAVLGAMPKQGSDD